LVDRSQRRSESESGTQAASVTRSGAVGAPAGDSAGATAATAVLPDRVLVVAGPTATGKTELAIALARVLDAEIVSADSRQIYRGMDIGTAKPSRGQLEEIPHHLIDVVDPDEDFDVARWRAAALSALATIARAGRRAIVCGGTGLYLRSLLRGLFDGPAADQPLRGRLLAAEAAQPGSLHARLASVDPESAARIHANDLVRTVRAIEVLELTGKPMSRWQREHALAERPFEHLSVFIDVSAGDHAVIIDRRSRAMVEAGIVEETAALHERFGRDRKAFDAIGYRETAACLDGELSRSELARAIAAATRRCAKRQRTWLRGQLDAVAVAPGDLDAALRLAERLFSPVATREGIG
jgi:tRNA dimethylallyltransferase